ncbi:MAG TPA: hypothetical protein VHM70_30425 [Polyangiaceae bacterium]|nr:hypothetical protein [Polyangiaceae bacterium]
MLRRSCASSSAGALAARVALPALVGLGPSACFVTEDFELQSESVRALQTVSASSPTLPAPPAAAMTVPYASAIPEREPPVIATIHPPRSKPEASQPDAGPGPAEPARPTAVPAPDSSSMTADALPDAAVESRPTLVDGGPQSSATQGSGDAAGPAPIDDPTLASCEPSSLGDELIYDGNATDAAGVVCAGIINPPRVGTWRAFTDGSRRQPETTPTPAGSDGGRAGRDDCAMHTTGRYLVDWGGGIEFTLHEFHSHACPYDASAYRGVELWLKGTTSGTYSFDYEPADDVVRIQVKSGDRDDGGDEYGFFCEIDADSWTRCRASFDELETEGWDPHPPEFESSWLRGIAIIAHRYDEGPPVNYDFWVDDVSFY